MKQVYFNYLYNYEHNASVYVPPHNHNIYEMVFYNEGNGKSRTADGNFVFSRGKCILYAPGVDHDETHESYTNVDCVGFYLEDNILPTRDFTDAQETEMLFKLKERLKVELLYRKSGYSDMANYIVGETVVEILRSTNIADASAADGRFAACVEYAAKFMDENFYREVDIKKLANIQGYSYEHFRHLFKAQCGIAPKQYLLKKRLAYAEHLLTTAEISVNEVAAKSGFENLSMFSFIFKKHYGLSPTEFRLNAMRD